MRIISGRHRGRQLVSPKNALKTRPTADRTREMMFNILLHGCVNSLEGLCFLEGFAGTGALGFEALSRGAAHGFFVEKNAQAMAILKENGRLLQEEGRMTCYPSDLLTLPRAPAPCHLIFLDPPYEKNLAVPALKHLEKQGWLHHHTWMIVEVGAGEQLELPASYVLKTVRACGPAEVYFFYYQEKIL